MTDKVAADITQLADLEQTIYRLRHMVAELLLRNEQVRHRLRIVDAEWSQTTSSRMQQIAAKQSPR